MATIDYRPFNHLTLGIVVENNAITRLLINDTDDSLEQKTTDCHRQAFQELDEYFKGERKIFTLPLNPTGTVFQKRVWKELATIPYGKTASYKEIACALKNEKAYRAVGNANGKNPIPIITPCHRVILSDGSLGGYTGGTDIKDYLLNLERGFIHG